MLISFPKSKINLGLHILDRRSDRYHNIESVFYPVSWLDALEILQSEKFSFQITGLQVPGSPEDNFCVKAYQLLKKTFDLPPVQIILLKNIPLGAGLGGGSSDGATTLKMLNKLLELNLSVEELKNYALKLGSDCPFFIEEKPCKVTGRGEVLENIAVDLSGLYVQIIFSGIEISTAWAFKELSSLKESKLMENLEPSSILPIESVIKTPVSEWRNHLKNEFEDVVFEQYPQIANIKKMLYDEGALYASMSGSGSAIYGLFEDPPQSEVNSNFRQFTGRL